MWASHETPVLLTKKTTRKQKKWLNLFSCTSPDKYSTTAILISDRITIYVTLVLTAHITHLTILLFSPGSQTDVD